MPYCTSAGGKKFKKKGTLEWDLKKNSYWTTKKTIFWEKPDILGIFPKMGFQRGAPKVYPKISSF